jgi:excisionase family DNA binding protein
MLLTFLSKIKEGKMTDYPPPVMTIEEASKYLQIPLSSLYKLAQDGKIPCQKVGRHWRFRKETIDQWLDQNLNLSKNSKKDSTTD